MPTYSQRISSGLNNGYWAGSWFNSALTTNIGMGSAGTVYSAWRFTGVNIPQGTTINSATLQIAASETDSSDVKYKVYGIAEDNTADFSTDPGSRTKTTSSTIEENNGQTSNTVYSIDVTATIQEIINRAGWVSGNALGLITADNGTLTGNFSPKWGFDGSATLCGFLTITYTSPTTTSTTTTTSTSTSTSTTTTSTSTSSTTLPPESYGIYVKQAGPKIILPKTLPRNFFMNSNYKLLRVHQQGSFKLTIPKGDAGGSQTIGFPELPYRPLSLVYMQRYNQDGSLDSTYHLLEWSYWGASKVGWQQAQIYPDKLIINYRDQIVEELLQTSFSVLGYYYIFREKVDG